MAMVERTKLSPASAEYQDVARDFGSKSMVDGRKLKLLSIEKVENPTLQMKFLAKKQEYEQTYGHVRVVKGWHGTKQTNVVTILRDNYDVARHGQNRGHRFGAGVSFSRWASYASHFSDKTGSTACMLLNDVLVSNIVNVPENRDRRSVLRQPPLLPGSSALRYDTTAKNKDKMDVFVKFEKDSFLPTHVVQFQRPARPARPARGRGIDMADLLGEMEAWSPYDDFDLDLHDDLALADFDNNLELHDDLELADFDHNDYGLDLCDYDAWW